MDDTYCWEPVDDDGFEHCAVAFDPTIRADGVVVSVGGDERTRVRYRLRTDAAGRTRTLRVERFDPATPDTETPTLSLAASREGTWTVDDDVAPALDGCLDVDVAVTPFTNALPIRRLGLAVGESATVDVVYVDPLTFEVSRATQRYTRLRPRDDTADTDSYRYESLTSGFTETLSVDEAGVVRDYPGLFRRVRPSRSA